MTLTHDFVFGYSDDETVMLDMDDTDLKTVKKWAKRALTWHHLEGYIILESSPGCFHVLFNRKVSWAENMRVVAWVAQLSGIEGLQRWHRMQCIKMKSTLRISNKAEKKPPIILKKTGKQKERIKKMSENRFPMVELTEVNTYGN
jgi:hypothetical protein